MSKVTMQTLGRAVCGRRGDRGLRETAREIEISPATLTRIENGQLPDLETFRKICKWLQVDAGQILGLNSAKQMPTEVMVHFRKDRSLNPKTSKALAEVILVAQKALYDSESA